MGKPTRLNKRIQTLDPRIARTTYVERIRGRTLQRINERIKFRDEYTCRICQKVTAYGEVDHIVPLFAGGGNNDENLQYICRDCHQAKSDREETERGQM